MKTFLPIVFLLLLAVQVHGQVRAVVTGPKEAVSGDMVILDASQSQGEKRLWKLLESDKSFLAVEGNLKCVFAAGVDVERTFHFVLVIAGPNANGSPEVDIATHDLVMKPRNQPAPTPTPPPGPNPPIPVPVPGKITGAILLYESSESTQDLTRLTLQLRNDKIPHLKVLDKDAKQGDSDEPVKQVQEIVRAIGGKTLPRVAAVDSSGSVVADADVKTVDDVKRLLASWGLQ